MPGRRNTSARVTSRDPTIDGVIRVVRGERVILDADLANIYGVATKVLNQAVKRNRQKFPADFLFQLASGETDALNRSQLETASSREKRAMRSQIVTGSKRNVRHRPYAFTEHGAIMAANILNNPSAVQMSVFVVRAFVKMRSVLADTRELARKLASLEKELTSRLDNHEAAIVDVLQRIMALLDPPPLPAEPRRPEMGFTPRSNRIERSNNRSEDQPCPTPLPSHRPFQR
jgi:hypothetical protein